MYVKTSRTDSTSLRRFPYKKVTDYVVDIHQIRLMSEAELRRIHEVQYEGDEPGQMGPDLTAECFLPPVSASQIALGWIPTKPHAMKAQMTQHCIICQQMIIKNKHHIRRIQPYGPWAHMMCIRPQEPHIRPSDYYKGLSTRHKLVIQTYRQRANAMKIHPINVYRTPWDQKSDQTMAEMFKEVIEGWMPPIRS